MGGTPPVSLIIPVWNRLEFTQHCLAAVAAHTPYDLYEVIVVDNGSTDGTGAFLAGLEGDVTVIANPVNLGFARACNQGAAAARGRYLLFLNNDTAPQPGWLEALLAAAERDPRIAAVGAKLLYPDDTIQHAGVALRQDDPYPISPVHLHRLRPADFPPANEEREVAAVTGACLLIRADVFRAVGGFDEGYVNGYEDVDLCLQVRARGHRIVYAPASVVYHDESATPGRHARERENLARLHEKWLGRLPEGVLEPPPAAPSGPADDGGGRGPATVIVVTYNSLSTIAPCLRSVARALGPEDEVIVVDNASRDGTRAYLERVVAGWERFRVVCNGSNLGFSRACNRGLRLARGELIVFLNPDTVVPPRWLSRLAAHLRDPGVGAVGPVADRVAGLQKHELYLGGLVLPPGAPVAEVAEALYRQNRGTGVETKVLIGFCLMLPRRVLDRVGPLDEDLYLGHEDLELSWRLRRRGYRLLVAADVFVRHRSQVSFRSDPKEKTDYLTRQSANILAAKLARAYGHDGVPPAEDLWGISWFRPARGLTTVIVLCAGDGARWEATVGTLLRYTPQPLEVILCGPGAPASPPAWLARRGGAAGVPVTALPGDDALQAALDAARGDRLVLLAAGALATPHWLARLQAAAAASGAGAVAAATGPWPGGERRPLATAAEAHFLEHAGILREGAGPTPCLLFPRAALAALQAMIAAGEGPGELPRRLQAEGWRVVTAEDVLVPRLEAATPITGPGGLPAGAGSRGGRGCVTPMVVCVLGMHRSGTSLTMGLLHRLGVHLGRPDNLMPPTEDNPEGYWENNRIMHLNDAVLHRLGGSWDDPPDPPPGWAEGTLVADLLAEARTLVEEEFAGHPLWGWKDPRTSLLVPFWRRVVPAPRYVLCVRNPLEVADSLQARDGFSLEKAADLWLRYTARALRDTEGQPCLIVHYEDYFADLDAQVERLARFIGVPVPEDRRALHSFRRADLRRHRRSLNEALAHPGLPLAVKCLYHALAAGPAGAKAAASGSTASPK